MISNKEFALFAALDLNPIKVKLMHKESGEGWSLERASAIETEYRRFLYLMHAYPDAQVAPTVDVDTFWHYHILDTMKYARDCEQTFGRFLHHYPYLGMEGDEDAGLQRQAGERMRQLYEATFGLSYVRPLRPDGSVEAADVQTATMPGTGMGEAANSAWCLGTTRIDAAGVQTAWCLGTTRIRAGAAPSAWCLGTTRVEPAGAQAAWCLGTTRVTPVDAQTAWCLGTTRVEAADVQTAWCLGTTRVKAADVQTAWCLGTTREAA